jgi:hypothetical protein
MDNIFRKELTIKCFNRVNGEPIKIYDEEINDWKIMDTHPVFGLDYYVIITSKYIMRTDGHGSVVSTEHFIGREIECISPIEFDSIIL